MTAHVDGPHLHVANAGDCGAVLGTQNEDGTWEAKPLSIAHHTESKAEQVRFTLLHNITSYNLKNIIILLYQNVINV